MILQRKWDSRFVLTSFASREVPEEMVTADQFAQQLITHCVFVKWRGRLLEQRAHDAQ
ncbi:MAG: hypothetical protein ABJB09_01085 [Verrucomicrobiota bacterium]